MHHKFYGQVGRRTNKTEAMSKKNPALFLFAAMFIPVAALSGADVTLAWDANTDSNLAGYKLYIGTSSRLYYTRITVGNNTSYTARGLSIGTYYFAVTAYDAGGVESGFSNEVVKAISSTSILPLPDTTPPVPDLIPLPKIRSSRSITVTTFPTATDNCSGKITATTTSPLSYAAKGTYTIVWVYTDAAGNVTRQNQTVLILMNSTSDIAAQSVSPENERIEAQGPTEANVTYIPRPAPGRLNGISVVNLDSAAATLKFTATNITGETLTGDGIENPAVRTLAAGAQLSVLDTQLFGDGLAGLDSAGWIRMESSSPRVGGMYLSFDEGLSRIDGSSLVFHPDETLVLPEDAAQGSTLIGDGASDFLSAALPLVSKLQTSFTVSHVASNDYFFTGITLLNPNDVPADADAYLFAADGSVIASAPVVLPARGRVTKLVRELFPAAAGMDLTTGYIRVMTSQPVAAYSIIGTTNLSAVAVIPAVP
jgi:hypothetical protein